MCLHYGQSVFEGMKAYRAVDGRVLLFRPDRNMARLNVSNDRLCIPAIDEEFCTEAIAKLVSVDKDWIPHSEGTSLYIRPLSSALTPTSVCIPPSTCCLSSFSARWALTIPRA